MVDQYHARQSPYSDPGRFAHRFDDIDPTVEVVSSLARNLIVHYRTRNWGLPAASVTDINLRWVAEILATDHHRHGQPLTLPRPAERRVQGCCRDHTLLAVAVLRHHGVPARSRLGFAPYLTDTDWTADHAVVEAWMGGRWRRFDPEFDEAMPRLADPTDIAHGPDGPFLTAAEVWLGCREGTLDPGRFGADETVGLVGDSFVHAMVIREVAHRFGDELLLWDRWGAMHWDLLDAPEAHVGLVDEIARLLVRADTGDVDAEAQLWSRYRQDPLLHPGQIVRGTSPTGDTYHLDLVSGQGASLKG
jgi:hypothetical protein